MMLLRVALPVGVARNFDYLPLPGAPLPACGTRVRVPFGRQRRVGVVVEHIAGEAPDPARYKSIEATLDATPLLPPELLELCRWCARYYAHPLGQVIATALPAPLRGEAPAQFEPPAVYVVTDTGRAQLDTLPARHVVQRALLEHLCANPATRAELPDTARGALATAMDRGWVAETRGAASTQFTPGVGGPSLTAEQAQAWTALAALPDGFSATLLDGVTGSGKTELYLRMAERALAQHRQVLVLAPEIGLTPQLVARFTARFGPRVRAYHSGMGEAARLQTWLAARDGHVDLVVGTRSAVFVPLARPGLIVIDEEHDTSYKQQDGLRYSARDLAVLRAHRNNCPILLGSATPSLESLHNAAAGRYGDLHLAQRVNTRAAPAITLLDIRHETLDAGLSAPLLAAAHRHLDAGGQVLFFINRRGYAPVLMCHECGWMAPCPHCDATLTLHRRTRRLVCHHCGYQQAPPGTCPGCGHFPLAPVGQGTERIEDALRRHFPGLRVERVDSDRTRSASALERLFDAVRDGSIRVLVGTQILAKGHDFAGLTLAGLVDVDGALFGTDFRALEHMAQLVTQVAGRVGRGTAPGEVILQTHQPLHPQLLQLVHDGYAAMARTMLEERRAHALPPFTHLVLLRAEAPDAGTALEFLQRAATALGNANGIDLLGPIPAVMERRAGRHRAQLLIRGPSRTALHSFLAAGMEKISALRAPRTLRWSVDVDPADLY